MQDATETSLAQNPADDEDTRTGSRACALLVDELEATLAMTGVRATGEAIVDAELLRRSVAQLRRMQTDLLSLSWWTMGRTPDRNTQTEAEADATEDDLDATAREWSTFQPRESDLRFAAWCRELDRLHGQGVGGEQYGSRGVLSVTGASSWRDYFDDGHTPADALSEDASHA